ncbi:hypothetical protein NQ317_005285, partial [Molorchus minor]
MDMRVSTCNHINYPLRYGKLYIWSMKTLKSQGILNTKCGGNPDNGADILKFSCMPPFQTLFCQNEGRQTQLYSFFQAFHRKVYDTFSFYVVILMIVLKMAIYIVETCPRCSKFNVSLLTGGDFSFFRSPFHVNKQFYNRVDFEFQPTRTRNLQTNRTQLRATSLPIRTTRTSNSVISVTTCNSYSGKPHLILPIAKLTELITYPLLLQALQDNNGLSGGGSGAVSHFEPQVAMLCDVGPHGQEAYHPKYMTEQGEWMSDLYSKATCFKDKMDILNYCKKTAIKPLFFSFLGAVCTYS